MSGFDDLPDTDTAVTESYAVPRIGDELEAIVSTDKVRCGDKGRVTEDVDLRQFEVTWYRSGNSTTVAKSDWMKSFRPTGDTVQIPCLGDEVQVLPGVSFRQGGKDYYGQGDRGKVSKSESIGEDNIKRFEVTWYRSGLTSTMKSAMWLKHFRIVERCTKKLPVLGDEVECLPAVQLTVEQKDYYRAGDRGRVCRNMYTDPEDGINRFEVAWYRTGLTSTMKADCWLKNFRLTAEGMQTPSLGDEVECLPMANLSVNEKDYYRAGDRGRVTKDVCTEQKDNIERFEVTWYRTGLTSTMKADAWLRNFRLTAKGMQTPSLGDEVECLPMSNLSVNEKDYYRACDRGRVTKDVYIDSKDDIERFEVTWYRTGLTSTMKKAFWLRHFRLTEVGIKMPSIGDELEALPGANRTEDGKNYYGQGDKGKVSKDVYTDNSDGKEKFHVIWERTELTSKEEASCWFRNFKLIAIAPQVRAHEKANGKVPPKNATISLRKLSRKLVHGLKLSRTLAHSLVSQDSSCRYFVVVGNPGVGKSTILSGFFRNSEIEFGHTFGEGMTIEMTKICHPTEPDFFGLDLPGLEDPDPVKRQKFATELTNGLSQKGSYQIVFVLTVESGRINQSSVEMITRVLASVPVEQNQFGVIVNKIDEDTMISLSRDDGFTKLTKSLNEAFKPRTAHVHFQEYNDGMRARKSSTASLTSISSATHATLPRKMVAFLNQLPVVYIDPKCVGEVEKMSDIQQRRLKEEAERSNALYKKQIEELESKYKELDLAAEYEASKRRIGIQLYTLGVVVPLNLFALYLFVVCFTRRGYHDHGIRGYSMSVVIPCLFLFLGHLPSLLFSNFDQKAMAEWLIHQLARRAINIVVDFTSLYDICQDFATGASFLVQLVLFFLALSIAIEMVACNTGCHTLETRWGDLLKVLDRSQVVLTCAVYLLAATPLGLLAGCIKALIQFLSSYE